MQSVGEAAGDGRSACGMCPNACAGNCGERRDRNRNRRAPAPHATPAPGQLNVDSDGTKCGTAYRFRKPNPLFGKCTPGTRHILKRFLGFKHRDIGTAIYLTTTNVGFEDFTSVDETTAVRQVQVWTDQAGSAAAGSVPGLSGFPHQLFQNFVVAATSGNRLNSGRFCNEAQARGIVQAGNGCTHCHAWPRTMQGHPGDFAENPVLAANQMPRDFFAGADNEARQLTGMNIGGEGNSGAQMAKGWTFVDFQKNDVCGVVKAVGFTSFVGQEFAAARFVETGTKFVAAGSSSSPSSSMLPSFDQVLSLGEGVFFENVELVESRTQEFPKSGGYLVTSNFEGTQPTLLADLLATKACVNNPNEDNTLCAADKTWWSQIAIDLQATEATVNTGEDGGDVCVPNLTALKPSPSSRATQTITGDIPLGTRGGFHGFRYASNVVVGKQYHATIPCADMITSGPIELSWGHTSFVKGVDPERAAEVVLELQGTFDVDATWSEMVIGGTHDVFMGTGHFDDVAAFPKPAPAAVAGTFGCCSSGSKTFIRVKVGERLARATGATAGVDVDTQVSLTAVARSSNSKHACATACTASGGPWPFSSSFVDTSVADASKQQQLRAAAATDCSSCTKMRGRRQVN